MATQQMKVGYDDDVIGTVAVDAQGNLMYTGNVQELAELIESVRRQPIWHGMSNDMFVANLPRILHSRTWAAPDTTAQ